MRSQGIHPRRSMTKVDFRYLQKRNREAINQMKTIQYADQHPISAYIKYQLYTNSGCGAMFQTNPIKCVTLNKKYSIRRKFTAEQ